MHIITRIKYKYLWKTTRKMAGNGRMVISIVMVGMIIIMNMTWGVNSKKYGANSEELKTCIKSCIPEKCMPEANNLIVCEKACHKYCTRPTFNTNFFVPATKKGFLEKAFCKFWC